MLLSYDDLRKRLSELQQLAFSDTWSDNLLDEIRKTFAVSRDVVAIALQEINLAPGTSITKSVPCGRRKNCLEEGAVVGDLQTTN